jgi:hypothetical protein
MHTHYRYEFENSIEHEFKYKGKWGAKGESRGPKTKATQEQIQKQNQRNKENKVRRKIKANFLPNDLWITLKPNKEKRKSMDELVKDVFNFLKAMKRAYEKEGEEFKYIYRLEIGKRGGLHCHILINRIRGHTDLIVKEKWGRYGGTVSYEAIHEAGGYKELAAYLVKMPDEAVSKQLSFFEEPEQKDLIRYSCSRNLITPEPEVKEYTQRTVKKLVENGPTPTPGFYIDKNSIVTGINPYTGMSYYYYTEVRIKPRERDGTG